MKRNLLIIASSFLANLTFGQIIFEQGFESNNVLISNCNSANWCNDGGQVVAVESGVQPQAGALFFSFPPGNSVLDKLVSPTFIKVNGNYTMGFWMHSYGEESSWEVSLLDVNQSQLALVFESFITSFNFNEWTYKEYTIPAGFVGDYALRFENNACVGCNSVGLDNIILFGPQTSTNVNELFSKQFKIYYDLNNSKAIKIAYAHDINDLSISVVNIMGQTVYTKETNAVGGQTETLNTGELQSGIYFVNVSSGGLKYTRKVMI